MMTRQALLVGLLALLASVLAGCGGVSSLRTTADPLEDMEVARTQFDMPEDEEQRQRLPLGVFTGIEVGDSRQTLQALMGEPEGVLVTKVVENSPAVAADIRVADILLEATVDDRDPVALAWPSDWYKIEQTASTDSDIYLLYDRAGKDLETTLKPVVRLSPPARLPGNRFREESKVGLIVRNASEVEAHAAGLARGEGSVVVGLARRSPWREAGVEFGDVILAVNDQPVKNPQELLAVIGGISRGRPMAVTVFRENQRLTFETTVTQREREVKRFGIPLIYTYSNDRGVRKTSFLLGLYKSRKTAVAAQYRLLWLINYTVGDANRLEEVK